MSRPRLSLLALVLLALALAACGRPGAGTEADLTTADSLLRCGVGAEPAAAYRDASRALIDAARRDPTLAGSEELIVAYEAPRAGLAGLRGTTPRRAAAAVRADFGLSLRRTLGTHRELVAARDPFAAAERLLDDPRVRYAHPNLSLVPHAAPNDAEYGRQWYLSDFGLEGAWDVEIGANDVTLAVIDTGVDVAHPEFAGRLEWGWDFYSDVDDPEDGDVSSPHAAHGTHVTGIAAATGDNGDGIAGVARAGVRILPIKVFDDYGSGAEVAAVARAIRWAAGLDVRDGDGRGPMPRSEPVQVINLSLGTAGGYLRVPELDEAVRAARRAGVVVVASVGNEGTQLGVTSPANGPCALAVGSVDGSLERSSFSNHDTQTRLVDLVAPAGTSVDGEVILSTIPNGRYDYMSGTSMAAPYVAGAAALLRSANPTWTDEQVIERLLSTAQLPPGGDPLQIGFGIACVDAALGAATACGR